VSGRLILTGGRVLDPAGTRFLSDTDIVIEDGRIASVEAADAERVAGDVVQELDGGHVIPGLIDAHFHLVSRSAAELDTALIAGSMIEGVVNAASVLAAGVTTVRDCGCRHRGIHELTQAVGSLVPGPRIFAAGLNPTGRNAPRHWRNVAVRGPEEMRAAVAAELEAGATFIKLVIAHAERATDWGHVTQYLSEAEVRAAVEEAHARGALVGGHIEGAQVAEMAVRAGLDVLDHSPLLTDATVALMAERGTAYVPTLWAFSDDSGVDLDRLSPAQQEAVHHWREQHRMSIRRAYAAGVRIAAGSDAAGATPSGTVLLDELDSLARCGLDETALLAAATSAAAAVLDQAGALGTIVPGANADLVVLRGDPLVDITVLREPALVISRGELMRDPWRPSPERLVGAVTARWGDD
jgi:imidazolonepropionase-like amidohydrolase